MCLFNCEKPKKSLPLLLVLLVVAQINLSYAFNWPPALLALLHLAPASSDSVRGMSAGLAASIDVLTLYQLARIWARHTMKAGRDPQND